MKWAELKFCGKVSQTKCQEKRGVKTGRETEVKMRRRRRQRRPRRSRRKKQRGKPKK